MTRRESIHESLLFIALLTLLTSSLSLFPAFSHAADKGWPDEVTVGYQKYGSLIILKATGELEKRLNEHGVKVNWAEFQFGPPLLEAMNAGKVDFGITGETPPVFAQAAAGSSIVYVAYEPASPKGEGLLVKGDSPLKNVAELKGKKVAVAKGSNSHYFLIQALSKASLTLNDIILIYLAPADARSALEQGHVDAWSVWDYFYASAEIQAGARPLTDGEGIVDNHAFYLSRRAFTDQYPEAVKSILEEVRKADKWVEANPADAAKALADTTRVDAKILERAIRRSGYGPQYLTPEVIAAQQKIADTLHDIGLILKSIVVKDAVRQSL
ncbi:Sulfonate ABC transporter substrate-binding protein [Candidatus Methylobacter favarea]|uniref:Putative aliphatic sulfonates-binding protein n=1 Tax=Candidatus Methylobacter favarea TaxID=2707345 RepID=A0A8S0X7H7_9GAMM|nr:sulfonate ABC transporter substrate-binding protein [Candidatus Methylobacter favarea]CAA9890057.1 Sulfonate ABC transporter substrate-binding protein [Candidatus Methylobacter favarea]